MEFEQIDFMTPIIEFVESYPELHATDRVGVIPFTPPVPTESNGLAYMGSTRSALNYTASGDIWSTNQANFTLYITRQLIGEYQNQELANFIANFERWVLVQNLKGKTPRFSNTFDTFGNFNETFWADNGFMWNVVTENVTIPFIQYQIQLHTQYQLLFESGGF